MNAHARLQHPPPPAGTPSYRLQPRAAANDAAPRLGARHPADQARRPGDDLSDPSIEVHASEGALRLGHVHGDSILVNSSFTEVSRPAGSSRQHELLLGFESSSGAISCLDISLGQVRG